MDELKRNLLELERWSHFGMKKTTSEASFFKMLNRKVQHILDLLEKQDEYIEQLEKHLAERD